MNYVNMLILGAGWTSDFLIPLLREKDITFAATTRDGRTRSDYDTITFQFDADSDDPAPFTVLPEAQTVLISFPIYKSGASTKLVRLWKETHGESKAAFVQLGSTGIWNGDPTAKAKALRAVWCDRHSPFNTSNERARAEAELLKLSSDTPTTVLNLSGLWGGQRSPRNWVRRVAPTKESLARKGSLHLIHGIDVARAILSVHQNFESAAGQRWLLTDCRVYDWWDLASAWGEGGTAVSFSSSPLSSSQPNTDTDTDTSSASGTESAKEPIRDSASTPTTTSTPRSPQPAWVRALMAETGVHALPRPPGALERALDSREFWDTFGISPVKTLLSP